MVFYELTFSTELSNLTNLQSYGGCDDPELCYYFKVKCKRCGEVSDEEMCLSISKTIYVGLFLPAFVRPMLDSYGTVKQVPQPELSDVVAGVTGQRK